MKTLLDLKVGDQIQAYMRQSLPLKVGRRVDGTEYRFVSGKPQRAKSWDISRFHGTITANDTVARILTVNTVGINSRQNPISTSPALTADISYTAFDRVFLLSAFHFEPREEIRRGGNAFRPTTKAIGTAFKAFRTKELVHIPQ